MHMSHCGESVCVYNIYIIHIYTYALVKKVVTAAGILGEAVAKGENARIL